MRRKMTWALLLTAAVGQTASAQIAEDEAELAPAITVSGTGEAQGKPDMARIQVGVVTEAETAAAAVKQNTAAMEKLLSTLEDHGLSERDVQTSQFNVSPQYRHDRDLRDQDEPQTPRIVGYQVTNLVQITVKKLPELGEILDAVVQAGANRINGIGFEIDDRGKLLDEARREAIKDARHTAELYAQAAGVSLGKVLWIRDGGTVVPLAGAQPLRFGMAAAERAVPIAPGEQTITAHVTVTYALTTRRPRPNDREETDPNGAARRRAE